jgi:hypothetical protein
MWIYPLNFIVLSCIDSFYWLVSLQDGTTTNRTSFRLCQNQASLVFEKCEIQFGQGKDFTHWMNVCGYIFLLSLVCIVLFSIFNYEGKIVFLIFIIHQHDPNNPIL